MSIEKALDAISEEIKEEEIESCSENTQCGIQVEEKTTEEKPKKAKKEIEISFSGVITKKGERFSAVFLVNNSPEVIESESLSEITEYVAKVIKSSVLKAPVAKTKKKIERTKNDEKKQTSLF